MTNRQNFDNILLVAGFRRRSQRQNPQGQPSESCETKGCQSRTETEEKELNTRKRPLFLIKKGLTGIDSPFTGSRRLKGFITCSS